MNRLPHLALTVMLLMPPSLIAQEIRGHAGMEGTWFFDEAAYPGQEERNLSLSGQAELHWSWNEGFDSLTVTPFLRWDESDGQRSHADIREFMWLHVAENWESRIGIGKVFWGFIESHHLVDIVNQTDLVESPDGEEKLGQPMANVTFGTDNGVFDLFILPFHRPRSYPGESGRFRGPVTISNDDAEYESSAGNNHVDLAARWNHYLGEMEFALSLFSGTSREPSNFLATEPGAAPGVYPEELEAFYPQIVQAGLEAEYLAGDWTWKLESIYREGGPEDYFATVGGFEYTFYDMGSSGIDLGALLEVHYDQRGKEASNIYQNDVFLGGRLELNDADASRLLMGVLLDNDYGSQYWTMEASRRLGGAYRILLDMQFVANVDSDDSRLYAVRQDSFLRVELRRYF